MRILVTGAAGFLGSCACQNPVFERPGRRDRRAGSRAFAGRRRRRQRHLAVGRSR